VLAVTSSESMQRWTCGQAGLWVVSVSGDCHKLDWVALHAAAFKQTQLVERRLLQGCSVGVWRP